MYIILILLIHIYILPQSILGSRLKEGEETRRLRERLADTEGRLERLLQAAQHTQDDKDLKVTMAILCHSHIQLLLTIYYCRHAYDCCHRSPSWP